MTNTIYDVVWIDGKWKVKKRGAKRASANADKRPMAVKKARKFAKNNKPSQVRIMNRNGEMVKRDDYGSHDTSSRGSLTWERKSDNRFHYTLRASNPDKAFDTRYTIDVIGDSAEFIDHQPFGNDKKTRKTFDSNREAVDWAKSKKREVTRELEREGWRN